MTTTYANEYVCNSCNWHGDEPDFDSVLVNRCPTCGDAMDEPEPAPERLTHTVDLSHAASPTVALDCPSCHAKLQLAVPVQLNLSAEMRVEQMVGANKFADMEIALKQYVEGCKSGPPDRFFAEDNARATFDTWLAHIAVSAQ